ncbi:MAG: alcohol dehydrogenase catalytic domain-containing protein, partial [Planctomycetes bacterium]|nr:alcohol dehydrogenase catalytic domain-containing protein [Planctomycetota bacterium]
MKAVVYVERGTLALREVATPEPGPGQVRIRTAACGICATDLEMIAGAPRVRCPAVLGHEWSGVVDAAGPDVDRALVGHAVVAE